MPPSCYAKMTVGKQCTPDEYAARKYLLENPEAFIAYFSDLILAPFQIPLLKTFTTEPRLVVLLPAVHGKSTLLSKWYTIWRICQNPNIRIILGMKNDAEVSAYASSIRKEFVGNHELIRWFGPFKPTSKDDRWSNDAIDVYWRQITESQPTVEFVSTKSIEQVLGHRVDEYLLDDFVTPTTVNTQDQRDKQEEQFNMGIDTGPQYIWDRNPDWDPDLPSGPNNPFFLSKPDHIWWPEDLRPCGKPIVYEKGSIYGTVFNPDDLFHRKGRSPMDLVPGKLYSGNTKPFRVLYFDCWIHNDKNEATSEPLLPSRWDAEKLKDKEASIGQVDFNRRFRNIAIDESMTVFKKGWLKGNEEFPGCLDKTRSWGNLPYFKSDEREAKWFLSLGLDPSSGRKGEAASWSSYVLLAVDLAAEEPRPRYVVDIYREQMGFEDILSHLMDGDRDIEGFYTKYKYNIAVVEQNAAQKWLLLSPRRQTFEMNNAVRVVGLETQVGNKWDPVAGVASMQSMVQDGLLKIPYKNPSDREKSQEFIAQLLSFPEGICDYAMALWMSNTGIKDGHSKYKSWTSGPGRTIVNPYYSQLAS